MAGMPPAAYYGLQQPTAAAAAMYSAYGSSGLEDLAALQRSAAGLHTLVGASANPTVPQPGGLKAVKMSGLASRNLRLCLGVLLPTLCFCCFRFLISPSVFQYVVSFSLQVVHYL
jgi:hypothetical protein